MKYIRKIIIGCITTISLLFSFSCDTIDENDRFIEIEKPEVNNTVLLEDFTGVNCSNCPSAHKYAEEAKKAHGEKLVIVSIHAGPFSTPAFRTEAGTKYQEHFYPANNSYPAGMVSRQKGDKGFVETNSSLWSTLINERFIQNYPMNMELTLSADYTEENNSFTIKSTITAWSKVSDIRLQLWVTESKIVSPQKDGSNIIPDYIHNHILRDAVNGIWGEDILQEFEIGSPFTMTSLPYSLETKNWKTENLNIIGFIYDKNTEEVIYVTEIPLIQ